MSLENVITLDVDIKKLNYFIEPTVTANDRTVFVINLKDNDFPINLVDVSTITLVSKRLDGRSIITPGVKGLVVGHQVVFELGNSETAVNGRVSATVQLYDYAGRVSSIAFGYIVKNDPSASYLLNVGEITLIQIVLEEGPLRIKEATDAAIAANAAVGNVEAKIIEADAVILVTETVKDETLIVKDATQLVKDETLIVKNDTLLVKADIEAAAIYNTTQGDYAKAEADRLVGTDVSVLDNRLTTFEGETIALLAEKATKTELASVASGSPKGTYATAAALQTAFPTGNTNVYIVTADGNWYSWSGSAWVARGVYQSTGIADETVTLTKLSKDVSGLNNYSTVPIFTNGVLTKVEELDGAVVKKRTTLTYNTDETVNTVTEQTLGKTVITTVNYVNGGFTSTSNQLLEGGL